MNAGRRVLVAGDEVKLSALLCDALRAAGCEPRVAEDGPSALQAIAAAAPVGLLLDLILPGLADMAVCRQIRRNSDVPILVLTARADEIDRIVGLEIGADDHLRNPISRREVVAQCTLASHVHRMAAAAHAAATARPRVCTLATAGHRSRRRSRRERPRRGQPHPEPAPQAAGQDRGARWHCQRLRCGLLAGYTARRRQRPTARSRRH